MEDSNSYIGKGNETGPLNPFLEQILREIPNAKSETGSVLNSAACTGAINFSGLNTENLINFGIQGKNKGEIDKQLGGAGRKSSKITKKIRSNIASIGQSNSIYNSKSDANQI